MGVDINYYPLNQVNDNKQPVNHQDVINIHHLILKTPVTSRKSSQIASFITNFKKEAIHHLYIINSENDVFKIEKISTDEPTEEDEGKIKDSLKKEINLLPKEGKLDDLVTLFKNKGDYIIHYTNVLKENNGNETFLSLENLIHTKVSLSSFIKIKSNKRDFEFAIEQEKSSFPNDLLLRVNVNFKRLPKYFEFKIEENEYFLGFTKRLDSVKESESFEAKLVVKRSDFTNPPETIQIRITSDDEFNNLFHYKLQTESRLQEIVGINVSRVLVSVLGSQNSGKSTTCNHLANFMTSDTKTHCSVGNGRSQVTTKGEYIFCKKLIQNRIQQFGPFPYCELLSEQNFIILDNPPLPFNNSGSTTTTTTTTTNNNSNNNNNSFNKIKEKIDIDIDKQINGKYPNKDELMEDKPNEEYKADVFLTLFNVAEYDKAEDKYEYMKNFSIPIETITCKHKSFPIVGLTHYEEISPQTLNRLLETTAFPVLKSNIFRIPENPDKNTLFALVRKIFEIKRAKSGLSPLVTSA